jgi:predicted metal-binding protein
VKRAPGSGVQLADRLTAELALLGAVIQVTRVDCLSRCQSPCNVRLAGRRKRGFEFTQVQPEDARALAAFAHSYSKSDTGSVPDDDIPPTLRTQAR